MMEEKQMDQVANEPRAAEVADRQDPAQGKAKRSKKRQVSAGQVHIKSSFNNTLVVSLSEYLQEHGFFALPIRTPTVPAGGERLRFSLTAGMDEIIIDRISELCKAFGK